MAHCVLVHAGMAHCFLCVQVNVLETQHSVLVKNIKSSDDIELVLVGMQELLRSIHVLLKYNHYLSE